MWGAIAQAVVGLYSANQQNKANDKATDASVGEQRRQYDQTRQDQMPWLQAGSGALGQMMALNGGDFRSFTESPDYKFSYDQGMQALDRSAAARGGLYSGGHSADAMQFGSGLAAQNYNNYYNRLASMAGLGQTTASGLGSLGQRVAANIGNARASSYLNRGDTNSQLAVGLGGAFNSYYQRNQAQNQGGYQGNPYGGYYAQPAYTSTGASWQNGYGG